MSITVKSNVACVSCGTTAMRRAISRRVSADNGRRRAAPRRVCGVSMPREQAQQRRLAGAVRPEQPDDGAAVARRATRRAGSVRVAARIGERDARVLRSSSTVDVERPAAGALHVSSLRQRSGALNSGVLVTTVWYSPRSPHGSTPSRAKLREQLRPQRPAEPGLVEELGARRDDDRVAPDEPTRRTGRRSTRPTAARPRSGRRRAHSLGPAPMLLEQDVAEDRRA